ncbi:MAG: hypothetical protein PF961_12750 [Planctomycetota bacterium]|jgi:hypothetical protein|nr:hypothetical protein [Planctomycetota bacterium]
MGVPIPLADVPDARRAHVLHPELVPLDLVSAAWTDVQPQQPACARACAGLAHAVYHAEDAARSWAAGWGWKLRRRIVVGGGRCDLVTRDDLLALVFCGTRPDEVQNLRHDADAILTAHPAGGRVHRGFWAAHQQLEGAVDAAIAELAPRRIIGIGHSLGAALALLAAHRWPVEAVLAYGCPRLGDRCFAAIEPCPLYRFQNGADVVGHLPPQGLGYRHGGTLMYLSPAGLLLANPPSARLRRARFAGSLRYAVQLPALRAGACWFRDLADHGIHNYRSKLDRLSD